MRVLLVMMMLLLSACTDGPGAVKALMNAGYLNITIIGYGFPACGISSTRFHAVSPDGEPVDGVVCGEEIRITNTIQIVE